MKFESLPLYCRKSLAIFGAKAPPSARPMQCIVASSQCTPDYRAHRVLFFFSRKFLIHCRDLFSPGGRNLLFSGRFYVLYGRGQHDPWLYHAPLLPAASDPYSSYLDYPRLTFSGHFRADTPTLNNFVPNYNVDNLKWGDDSPQDNWNPWGSGEWGIDANVTSVCYVDGPCIAHKSGDPIIGSSVQGEHTYPPSPGLD